MNERMAVIGLVLSAVVSSSSACSDGASSSESNGDAGSDAGTDGSRSHPIVDTQQTSCYDDSRAIACPGFGGAFFGQDAQHANRRPSYTKSADGLTVHDDVTGLTWQQGYVGFKRWKEAKDVCAAQSSTGLGGYTDWRLPTIKELYSLWNGSEGWPYLDTTYFTHPTVDSHSIFWSSTKYSGLLESTEDAISGPAGTEMAFGVNFDTGHVKAYAVDVGPTHFARCVRGAADGVDDLVDDGDGTITDRATGLMWSRADSASGMDWQHALAFAQSQNVARYLGHDDWRLPNTKELQSLVDYTRSPGATDAAHVGPAIDPRFTCTPITNEAGDADSPWYWTSTSAKARASDPYEAAWYVAFGRAVGRDGKDLHGAGAVRFDAKVVGEAGGESRYLNYVRLVRDAD